MTEEKIMSDLKSLQKEVNGGRGINCVDTIIFFLENGETEKAKACTVNEWDKISGYPILADYIRENIYNPCCL